MIPGVVVVFFCFLFFVVVVPKIIKQTAKTWVSGDTYDLHWRYNIYIEAAKKWIKQLKLGCIIKTESCNDTLKLSLLKVWVCFRIWNTQIFPCYKDAVKIKFKHHFRRHVFILPTFRYYSNYWLSNGRLKIKLGLSNFPLFYFTSKISLSKLVLSVTPKHVNCVSDKQGCRKVKLFGILGVFCLMIPCMAA